MYKIPAKSLFVGKNLLFWPECHSTNQLAMEHVRQNGVPEGTTFIADYQANGKGQRGNVWISERGKNLTFSLVFYPEFLALKDQFLLSKAISLGVCDLLSDTLPGQAVKVKWPNDVMINGKKACGILIENVVNGSSFESAIVGIGLNVNQTDFPIPTATSMASEGGYFFVLADLLDDLCYHVEARYLQLKQQSVAIINEDYMRALHWMGEPHLFFSKAKTFAGAIEGVDEVGKLVIRSEDGLHAYDSKEILYLQ